AFDVGDVDEAASSFPELNFIVEHVGLPRLDDFCWIATQEPNVYGGIAVAAPMALGRPKRFSEIMAELLFWLGEDRLTFGSDYGIWDPDWLIEAVMETELSDEQVEEYGVEFDLEAKKKLMGENIAELYDIDIEERKKQLSTDAISQEFGLGDTYDAAAPADD
ncbi:amidohydrolase family protein, partial [Haloquadratum walsbyi]